MPAEETVKARRPRSPPIKTEFPIDSVSGLPSMRWKFVIAGGWMVTFFDRFSSIQRSSRESLWIDLSFLPAVLLQACGKLCSGEMSTEQ